MKDARHLGLGRLGKGRTSLALDQRLQAAQGIVVEFFVHGCKGVERPIVWCVGHRLTRQPE
ncbi:hypothetical protein D3C71_1902340 [compost metagenome]